MTSKNVCDDHELREFIDKYKLHQIEDKLISEGITISFLLSQTEREIIEISEELTPNKIQQNKLKAAVREIKDTKLSSTDSNERQECNDKNKRKNPYSNEYTQCSKRRKIDISSISNTSDISNNALPSISGLETCSICGSSMSSFLIDNHKRHCLNNYNNQNEAEEEEEKDKDKKEEKNIESPPPQSPQHDDIENEENVLIECRFCEFEYNVSMETDHEYHCGARTDLCSICKQRDTLRNFKENKHKCYQHRNDENINTKNDNMIENEWKPKFERQLYDLQKILHDRFVTDYNKSSSHFEQYDVFGNKKKIYSQKSNECISNIRGYNMKNHNSNDSRHKYLENETKSKDELRKEYDKKYKEILDLLKKIIIKIINNESEPKYKKLRCDNDKLKRLIFCYPQCCEFLKLCNFQYIDNMYYEMINIDNNRLKIALDALKSVNHSFQIKIKSEDKEQKKWESNQAIETNKNSPFHGCWACKKCNHLNKKTALKCSNCGWRKQSVQKTKNNNKPIINLSVKKWICGICGNRNAMQFLFCDNCKNDKIAIL